MGRPSPRLDGRILRHPEVAGCAKSDGVGASCQLEEAIGRGVGSFLRSRSSRRTALPHVSSRRHLPVPSLRPQRIAKRQTSQWRHRHRQPRLSRTSPGCHHCRSLGRSCPQLLLRRRRLSNHPRRTRQRQRVTHLSSRCLHHPLLDQSLPAGAQRGASQPPHRLASSGSLLDSPKRRQPSGSASPHKRSCR